MYKLVTRYENEEDLLEIMNLFSDKAKIKKISQPKKSGKFFRVYLDVEKVKI